MKLTIFTLSILCLIAVCKSADEEYDYEEEPAAPVTPAPARASPGRLGGLLSSRGRANVARKGAQSASAQSTTAKPVEQPVEEEEEEGDESLDESQEQQEEIQTTTTESSKKVRGGVRPFRSNEDLLAALKRRRAQVGPSGHSRDTSATHAPVENTTSKSKSSSNNRNKSTSGGSESRTANRGRFGTSRGGKPVQEEAEETQREEVQVKAKSYRRG